MCCRSLNCSQPSCHPLACMLRASVNPCSIARPQASYKSLVELCVRASQPRLAVQLCAEVSSLCRTRQWIPPCSAAHLLHKAGFGSCRTSAGESISQLIVPSPLTLAHPFLYHRATRRARCTPTPCPTPPPSSSPARRWGMRWTCGAWASSASLEAACHACMPAALCPKEGTHLCPCQPRST